MATDHRLNWQYKTYLKENFNTTVIIPELTSCLNLKKSINHNLPYLQRNGVEIIIIVNQESTSEILEFCKEKPLVNWKVLEMNTTSLAEAINAGILASSKDFILVLPPDTKFSGDVIYHLRYPLEYYEKSYSICYLEMKNVNVTGFGAFLTLKSLLLGIRLLDKRFANWHDLYFNTIARLDFLGTKRVFIDDVKLIPYHNRYLDKNKQQLSDSHSPKSPYTPDAAYPTLKYIYNWSANQFSKDICIKYLENFQKWEITHTSFFYSQVGVLALIQTKNESRNILEALSSLDQFVDGIILLDDNSTDNTFELAYSDKLILKAKKTSIGFNDLENRNMLLDLASFINSKWILFIDADERIDESFGHPKQFLESPPSVQCIGCQIVNVWSDEGDYIINIRDSNPQSEHGILFRWRMFRNIGRTQIIHSNTLHFRVIPFLTNAYSSNIIIRHKIPNTPCERNKKLEFYMIDDPRFDLNVSKGFYDTLIVKPLTAKIDAIKLTHSRKII